MIITTWHVLLCAFMVVIALAFGIFFGILLCIGMLLVRIPLLEVPMAQLIRHKTAAAAKELSRGDDEEQDELDSVGTVGRMNPETGRWEEIETP